MQRRYLVIRENLVTGGMESVDSFNDLRLAEIIRGMFDISAVSLGWIKDRETGAIGIAGDYEKGEVH